MYIIKVVSSYSGKPIEGASVWISMEGNFAGYTTGYEYTDENGRAYFDYDSGVGKVYVWNNVEYEGRISGTVTVSVDW